MAWPSSKVISLDNLSLPLLFFRLDRHLCIFSGMLCFSKLLILLTGCLHFLLLVMWSWWYSIWQIIVFCLLKVFQWYWRDYGRFRSHLEMKETSTTICFSLKILTLIFFRDILLMETGFLTILVSPLNLNLFKSQKNK